MMNLQAKSAGCIVQLDVLESGIMHIIYIINI